MTAASGAAGARQPAYDIRAFKPVADAYVTEARPRANFGRARVLRVDGNPLTTTYLRFRIARLKEDVATVTLLLHASRAGRTSFEVRHVDEDDWRESRLTYANAPRLSLRYAAARPVRRGAWTAVDVTPFVIDGEDDVNLAITTRGSREVSFHSRESKHGPRLVVRKKVEDDELGSVIRGLPRGE